MQNLEVTLYIDAERLKSFLSQNQLVQANAIAQRLEGIFQDMLKEGEMTESNRFWPMFKAALRVRSHILAGRREDAEREAVLIQTMINQTRGEKPCQP